jgi:hypothetical protein
LLEQRPTLLRKQGKEMTGLEIITLKKLRKKTRAKKDSNHIKAGVKFFFAPFLTPMPPFVPYSPSTTAILYIGWWMCKRDGFNRLFTRNR